MPTKWLPISSSPPWKDQTEYCSFLQFGFNSFGHLCNALGVALPMFSLEAYDFSTCFFTNVGNYQREIKVLAFSPLAGLANGVMIPAMTNSFFEAAVKEGKVEKRLMVNICYSVDSRFLEFDEYLPLFFEKVRSSYA